jgi:hypothetical protein
MFINQKHILRRDDIMLEVKIVTTTVLNKNKLAVVLGWSTRAEPDAKHGVYCGSRGLEDSFIICDTLKEAIDWTVQLNRNIELEIPVDHKIMSYIKRTQCREY